jgi:hypothetical protein
MRLSASTPDDLGRLLEDALIRHDVLAIASCHVSVWITWGTPTLLATSTSRVGADLGTGKRLKLGLAL